MSTKLSTTNISQSHLKQLKRLSNSHGLTQVDFINSSIDYFRKTGINPVEEIYSPREEIAKLEKRVEEILKFIRIHERDKLTPLVDQLIILQKRLSDGYSNVATEEMIKEHFDKVRNIINNLYSEIKKMDKGKQIYLEDLSSIISKHKSEYNNFKNHQKRIFELIFKAIQQKGLRGISDELINDFDYAIKQI